MRSIYLVLTQTGSVLSSAIKIATGKKYNHVSLSFDDSLHEMYSFGRKYPYNPFIGVFVVESINKGTYLRFKNTSCMVIEIPISDEKFDRLYSNVMDMVYNKDKYKYNVKGLFWLNLIFMLNMKIVFIVLSLLGMFLKFLVLMFQ